MRVLVVEDELFLAEALQAGLRHEAIAADVALDGDEALDRIASTEYDVLVLDRDIPGTHGDQVCARVTSEYPGTRVLMLTAATSLRDKVGGFELGADDNLTKPFALKELVARLRALARRPSTALPSVLEFSDLRLDPHRREAYRGGRYLKLTRKQFAVLEVLMRADGGVVSAEALLEKAGTRTPTPSRRHRASRSRPCAKSSATPTSSPLSPAWVIASRSPSHGKDGRGRPAREHPITPCIELCRLSRCGRANCSARCLRRPAVRTQRSANATKLRRFSRGDAAGER